MFGGRLPKNERKKCSEQEKTAARVLTRSLSFTSDIHDFKDGEFETENKEMNNDKISFIQRTLTIFSRRKRLTAATALHSQLRRCLTVIDLTTLGIGSTLGAGIYILAGTVARDLAGPAVLLSFLFAGLASLLSGLCYAELGSKYPRAGSAYVYSYIVIGELAAFITGINR